MNPYPFCELNYFTVPRAIDGLQSCRACIAYDSSEIQSLGALNEKASRDARQIPIAIALNWEKHNAAASGELWLESNRERGVR